MSFSRSHVVDMPLTCLTHFGMNPHQMTFVFLYNKLPHSGMTTCHIGCVRILDSLPMFMSMHVFKTEVFVCCVMTLVITQQNWCFVTVINMLIFLCQKCKQIVSLYLCWCISIFLILLSPAQLPFFSAYLHLRVELHSCSETL